MSKLCVSKLCGDKLCVDKLCGSKLCVDKLCVAGGGRTGGGRRECRTKNKTPRHKDVGNNKLPLRYLDNYLETHIHKYHI